jgi:hypothetical protein
MPRTPRLAASLLSLAALSTIPGCWVPGYTPGGQMASRDIATYESKPGSLKTVTLLNTETGQTVWEVDVPVNMVVVIRFFDNDETSSSPKSSLMRWQFMTPFDASLGGDLNNVIPCPGRGARHVTWRLREDKAPANPAVVPSLPPPEAAQPHNPPPSAPAR